MKLPNVLIVSDNKDLVKWISELILSEKYKKFNFEFVCSKGSENIFKDVSFDIQPIDIKANVDYLINKFNLIISLHCKQFFPAKLINSVRCINVHPGYNPINRGWYPQVFAIINETLIGATIHEMDEKLDHGKIIAREILEYYSWDTSLSIYNRILELEKKLIKKNLHLIIENQYKSIYPENEGFISAKNDIGKLFKLDLNEVADYKTVLNRIRALTHGDYKNAYYIDESTGKKVYVTIKFDLDE